METAILHGKVVEVLAHTGALTKVKPINGDEFDGYWVKQLDLKATPKKLQAEIAAQNPVVDKEAERIARGCQRICRVTPEIIPDQLLVYLQDATVKIRILYPAKVEGAVLARFSELGVSLPEDIRPVNNKQYSLSSEVFFPTPPDTSILPDYCKVSGNVVSVYRNSFALGLLTAGFLINSYAKQKPVV